MPYQPLARVAGRVHICGHRGHCVAAPENTLPSLRGAAARGATVCEIDVVLARDGEIVLLHDELLDRTTDGVGAAADRSLVELQRLDAGAWFAAGFKGTSIPTLAEALALAGELGIGLHIEIKERRRLATMLDRLAALLAEEQALDEVLVISFDHPSLVKLRERVPVLRTELITHARHVDPVGLARAAGAASVAIEWDMFHPDDALALHEAGIATRVTIGRPDLRAHRREHGLDDDRAIAAALSAGHIDILSGDDVDDLARLVSLHGPRAA